MVKTLSGHLEKLVLVVAVVLFGGEIRAQELQPFIFNVTKSAVAGDVVGIHGDQFGTAPTVWIDRLEPGDSHPNPEMQLTDVLTKSNQYIGVRLPTNLALGVYAIFVKSGTKTSAPGWVNRADGWHYLDLAGREIAPSFPFRITGRNLAFPGATPQVRFVNAANGGVLAASGVGSTGDSLGIKCVAPLGLSIGAEYHVEVNNGLANLPSAWVRMPGQPLLVRAIGFDLFGLGVPWGSDFAKMLGRVINVKGIGFNAVGNGVADDRAAIQKAIDTASAMGGGVVYLPSGVYAIGVTSSGGVDYNLVMKSNVVLMGEGMTRSTLVTTGGGSGLHAGLVYVPPGHTTLGFYNLTMRGGPKCSMVVNYFAAIRAFIAGCRLENHGGQGTRSIAWREGAQTVLKDSQFVSTQMKSDAAYFVGQNDLIVKNCYFEYHDGRIRFTLGERVQVESCTIARSVETDGLETPTYGGLVSPVDDFSLLSTSFIKLGNGLIPRANDGESVLCEYPSEHYALGSATAGGVDLLSDSSAAWKSGGLVGLEVMIIKGPGAGQRRTISGNTGNSLTVSQAWDVPPVAGKSYYNVTNRCKRHMIKTCMFNGMPSGIWYYRTPIDDLVISGNQFVDTAYTVLVRANQRVVAESYSFGNEFNTMSGILIEKNTSRLSSPALSNGPATPVIDAVLTSGNQIYGNFYYDCVMRGNAWMGNNAEKDWGTHIGLTAGPVVDNVSASAVGMIVQGNYFSNNLVGINLGTGNSQTVILGNVFVNVQTPLQQTRLPGFSSESVGTVFAP
ncbi:hypothetical protein FEM03_11010 [Phragmitibacter flavus]|uniref:Rhamnogalacturonase A/B/Epimerase-like pectate lyase domain-containing protein n=1 Tax=Phragmitibacter flavus TaxID=2576071 RepID=A0A5R8KGV2_9BACT|nr:glycosyl hydrolase family 28-related protein [Phragmitibacter flavus]TLD70829.1 hypothetical protein FEM03_11010 [Phragmitibacter flavus]